MTDKQLAVLYTILLVLWVGSFALLNHLNQLSLENQRPPTTAQGHADKLCQALHGPQVGAAWTTERGLHCQSARGERLELKNPAMTEK